ncbi:MAG TPA: ABC transporter substrate-binding protein [Stellaceae bacterium]|nr:ABC transporter substrate-binding protein [Stellaceae bacterium]
MSLRPLARIAILLLLLGTPLAARGADDASGFISDLGKRAIEILTSPATPADREQSFRALFDEGFDVPTIARFVLGPYWRTASDAQRQEFTKLFEAYIVHAYTVRFSEYHQEQFKVAGTRPEGDTAALVSSQIIRTAGAPPVKVDWRVSKTERGLKITDVIVEGISMAVTERQEFASVIQRGGGRVDALLKLLREKLGEG